MPATLTPPAKASAAKSFPVKTPGGKDSNPKPPAVGSVARKTRPAGPDDSALAALVAANVSDPDAPPVAPADLAVSDAFAPLSDEQRAEFLDLAGRHVFDAGETILHEGRTTRSLWFILSGTCEVVKSLPGGEGRVLATLEAGQLFGEMSFFSPAPHSASVRAVSDCVVLRMGAENWETLEEIGLRPAYMIARQTAAVMSDRLRRMDEWVTRVLAATPDPAARAARTDEWNDFRSKLLGG